MEAEIARLQHLDALVNSEKNTLAHQNNAIRELLSSHSLESNMESFNLNSSSQPGDDLSLLGGAAVDIRYDEEIGQERVFLDWPEEMAWTSDETSASASAPASAEGQPPLQTQRHAPVKGDSWAALDFILALEWPCKDHIKHHIWQIHCSKARHLHIHLDRVHYRAHNPRKPKNTNDGDISSISGHQDLTPLKMAKSTHIGMLVIMTHT